jgi:hypothetical protein
MLAAASCSQHGAVTAVAETAAPEAFGGEGKCRHGKGGKANEARPLRTRARARLRRRLTEKEGTGGSRGEGKCRHGKQRGTC